VSLVSHTSVATRVLRGLQLPQLEKKREQNKQLAAATTRTKSKKFGKIFELRCRNNSKKMGKIIETNITLTISTLQKQLAADPTRQQ